LNFNITKQSRDFDKKGVFIKTFCPELIKVPNALIHEPWAMSKEEQSKFVCKVGDHYP